MELDTIEAYVTCGEYLPPRIVLSSAIWAINWSVTRTTVSRFNGKFELALAFTSAFNNEHTGHLWTSSAKHSTVSSPFCSQRTNALLPEITL
jgi:hypothetical protein